MTLIELKPLWMEHEGQRVGIIFQCPRCMGPGCPPHDKTWVTCFFVPFEHIAGPDSQYELIAQTIAANREHFGPDVEANDVVPCKRDYAWTKEGDDFSSMSIKPSLDASASGHWHGYVTNGQIT